MQQYLRLIRRHRSRRHRAIVRLAARALHDDRGGQVVEYALVIGLVLVGVIGTVACAGTKVLNRWSSVNSGV